VYKWLARWRAASGCFTTEDRRTAEATAGGDASELMRKIAANPDDY
jgi:hypothetical protein